MQKGDSLERIKKSWDFTHAQLTLRWQLQNTSLQKHRFGLCRLWIGSADHLDLLGRSNQRTGDLSPQFLWPLLAICIGKMWFSDHGVWKVSNQATSSDSSHWIRKAGYSTIIWPGLKCQFQQKKRSISTRTNSNEPFAMACFKTQNAHWNTIIVQNAAKTEPESSTPTSWQIFALWSQ